MRIRHHQLHIRDLNNLIDFNKDNVYDKFFVELSDYIKEVPEDDTIHIYGLQTYISHMMESGAYEPN